MIDESAPSVRIRQYRPSDRAAVHDICIRTADAGDDATASYDDPNVLPNLFAHPYTHLDPGLTFVADDNGQAVGYVLGTPDTARFAQRFRTEWLPLVGDQYPAPPGTPNTPDEVMAHLLHTPERMVQPALAAYPAHLHIDLLPDYQRSGHGRALIAAFLQALDGIPLHIGMVTANHRARPFYDRLGFHEIPHPDPGPLTYLGRTP